MALQALIFAIDGVLAETHEARRDAFNKVFAEAGVAWHWDRGLYAELLKASGGEDMIGEFVQQRIPHCRRTSDFLRLTSVMRRRHATICQELFDTGAVMLRPGVANILYAAVLDGLRLAIASREKETHVSGLLRSSLGENSASVFEAVATASDCELGECAYESALRMLALPPEDCLAIDSSARGLSAAVAAEIPSVITWGVYPQLQECGEALLASEASCVSASLVLARWDCGTPAEVLDQLRRGHMAQTKFSRFPTAWPIANKELDNAGRRHLKN